MYPQNLIQTYFKELDQVKVIRSNCRYIPYKLQKWSKRKLYYIRAIKYIIKTKVKKHQRDVQLSEGNVAITKLNLKGNIEMNFESKKICLFKQKCSLKKRSTADFNQWKIMQHTWICDCWFLSKTQYAWERLTQERGWVQ